MSSFIADAVGVATAVGAIFVAWQLLLVRRQLRASFEQSFTDRYQELIARVPLPHILGEAVKRDQIAERAFYDYFELCEEELYYRRNGRVSRQTWQDWSEGIALHFRRPAFRHAWNNLKDRAVITDTLAGPVRLEQFTFLRSALSEIDAGKRHDPRLSWWRRRR